METWIHSLSPQCGPLVGAAEGFVRRHGLVPNPPRGASALKYLVRAIREERVRPSDDKRVFIEESGAFLALVLADRLQRVGHVSDGESAHALQLGQYGFFDPFACVQSALEATDVGPALVEGIEVAEEEASEGIHGRSGHVKRVVGILAKQLGAQTPPMRIARRFQARVWLKGGASDERTAELDLERVAAVTVGEPDTRIEAAVKRVVAALYGTQTTPAAVDQEARARVLPRLVGPSFIARLPTDHGHGQLLVKPLLGPIQLCVVVQYEGRARYLRHDQAAELGLDARTAYDLAVENLARLAERARVARVELEAGPMIVLQSHDGLDAARLLLPGLRRLLHRELGSRVLVGVPHRDLLLACAADDQHVVEELQTRVAQSAGRAPHAIHDGLLELVQHKPFPS